MRLHNLMMEIYRLRRNKGFERMEYEALERSEKSLERRVESIAQSTTCPLSNKLLAHPVSY